VCHLASARHAHRRRRSPAPVTSLFRALTRVRGRPSRRLNRYRMRGKHTLAEATDLLGGAVDPSAGVSPQAPVKGAVRAVAAGRFPVLELAQLGRTRVASPSLRPRPSRAGLSQPSARTAFDTLLGVLHSTPAHVWCIEVL